MKSKHGSFSGEPKTVWLTEPGADRRVRLIEEFSFIDPDNLVWRVPANYDQLDGASIPRALWSLVGSPFTGDYRRASIVHDHACNLATTPAERRKADRMFYHACREGGCSRWEALLLYAGVHIGAHLRARSTWVTIELRTRSARLSEHADERRARDDFRALVDAIAEPGETDDPAELEKRVDAVLDIVLAGV